MGTAGRGHTSSLPAGAGSSSGFLMRVNSSGKIVFDLSEPGVFDARVQRLVREVHRYGPTLIRVLRAEFGDRVVDHVERRSLTRRIRYRQHSALPNGDVALLTAKGRATLCTHESKGKAKDRASSEPKTPDGDMLTQRMARGTVLRHLCEVEGYEFEKHHRLSYWSYLRHPGGWLMLVVVNYRGYDTRHFRRMISSQLGHLLSGREINMVVFDPRHESLRRAVPGYTNIIEFRDLRQYLPGEDHILH